MTTRHIHDDPHPLPPRTHNTGDLPSLSMEENTYVEHAREALASLRKTFEFWVVIARGLKTLRDKADRIGSRFAFDRLREREGLGPETLNKTRVSRLLAILENQTEVEKWRATLTAKQRFDWASPEAVHNHCPVFTRPKSKNTQEMTPQQKLKRSVAQLEEENYKLKQDAAHSDTDSWRPTDKATDIARVMFEKLGRNKARDTANAILALLQGEGKGKKKTSAIEAG
jgi:hypothetical protein